MAEASVAGVHPAAQPYFFQGRDTGCLLIHGFTGSPPELLPLGKYLAERGCVVVAPLLAGHGTRVEDLAKTSWQDWLQSAAAGLSRLREEPIKRVFLIGISMGGLLSLMLAAEEQSARDAEQPQPPRVPVAGVVTINSPIFMQNRHARFSSLLRWFITSTPKNHEPAYQAAANALRFAYPEMPLNGVANLMQLVKAVRGQLPKVKVPALIVQSQADDTVLPVSGEYLHKYIGSSSKQLLWLKDAPHLVSLGAESEMVWRTVFEFIENNLEIENK